MRTSKKPKGSSAAKRWHPCQGQYTGAQLGTLWNVSSPRGDLPISWLRGSWDAACLLICCGALGSPGTKCLTLLEKLDFAMAKLDAGGWLNLALWFGCALSALPPISSCQWCVEEVANGFCVCWALGDVQRVEHCSSHGERQHCASKGSTHSPIFLLSQLPLWHTHTLPRHKVIY